MNNKEEILKERLNPYLKLDKKRLSKNNQNITNNDINKYNQVFLEVINSVYDNFKVNDYFVNDGFLYIVYHFISNDKLSKDEIINVLGEKNLYVGYKNKIILKGKNHLSSVLPTQAFLNACVVCKKLFEIGY